MARLHQATRERRQRRLQLLPRSMHRVTTAAHVLDPRLLLALSLHRSITTVWPCSFQRRYGPLARCTLPLPHLHQDQGLYSVLLRPRVLNGPRTRQPDSMTHCRVARIKFDHGRVGSRFTLRCLTSKPPSGALRLGTVVPLPRVASTTQTGLSSAQARLVDSGLATWQRSDRR